MGKMLFSATSGVAKMKGTFIYFPKITNTAMVEEWARRDEEKYIICGEYGISPLLIRIDQNSPSKLLYEILLSNKNRQLFYNLIISAYKARFAGIVIASGIFEKNAPMPMPTYDLDATQALKLALEVRKTGTVSPNFLIGVRAPSGSKPAELRAQQFIQLGADFIIPSQVIVGLEEHTFFCEEEIL